MQRALPGFFPGHSSLLQHAQIKTSEEHLQAIQSTVSHELAMMEHPSHIWVGNIEFRYAADPLIMKLVDKYCKLEDRAGPEVVSEYEEEQAKEQSSSPKLKPWRSFFT